MQRRAGKVVDHRCRFGLHGIRGDVEVIEQDGSFASTVIDGEWYVGVIGKGGEEIRQVYYCNGLHLIKIKLSVFIRGIAWTLVQLEVRTAQFNAMPFTCRRPDN